MIRLYILVYFCLNLFGTVLIYLCLSLHVCAFLLKSLLVFTWLSLSVPVCYHMHLSFRVCARLQPSVYVGTCLCLSMLEFPTVSVYTCYSLCLSFYLCLCLCLLYVPVPVCISTFSSSGIVQLGCLIFPKLYTVLFKPEKASRLQSINQQLS
jgi:hypothetical protein